MTTFPNAIPQGQVFTVPGPYRTAKGAVVRGKQIIVVGPYQNDGVLRIMNGGRFVVLNIGNGGLTGNGQVIKEGDGDVYEVTIGSVDLSNYYTKTETDTALAGKSATSHTHTPASIGAADAGHNHDGAYLAINGKAVDSDKLDGIHSTGFSIAGHTHTPASIGAADISHTHTDIEEWLSDLENSRRDLNDFISSVDMNISQMVPDIYDYINSENDAQNTRIDVIEEKVSDYSVTIFSPSDSQQWLTIAHTIGGEFAHGELILEEITNNMVISSTRLYVTITDQIKPTMTSINTSYSFRRCDYVRVIYSENSDDEISMVEVHLNEYQQIFINNPQQYKLKVSFKGIGLVLSSQYFLVDFPKLVTLDLQPNSLKGIITTEKIIQEGYEVLDTRYKTETNERIDNITPESIGIDTSNLFTWDDTQYYVSWGQFDNIIKRQHFTTNVDVPSSGLWVRIATRIGGQYHWTPGHGTFKIITTSETPTGLSTWLCKFFLYVPNNEYTETYHIREVYPTSAFGITMLNHVFGLRVLPPETPNGARHIDIFLRNNQTETTNITISVTLTDYEYIWLVDIEDPLVTQNGWGDAVQGEYRELIYG